MRGIERLHSALRTLEVASVAVAGAALGVIMMIVVVDVVLRYALNAPLPWSYGLISLYLTAAAFFFALSDTAARGHHVAVDILFLKFPSRGRHLAKAVGAVLGLPVFAAILWLAIGDTGEKWQGGDVLAGTIPWPTWIASLIVALGSGLLVLRFLLDIIVHAHGAATGRSPSDPTTAAREADAD